TGPAARTATAAPPAPPATTRPDAAPGRIPTGPAAPAPRPQAPQQPRPELRIDNRHDLTYRWHRRLRAHRRPARSGGLLEPGGPFPFRRAHPVAGHHTPASPTLHPRT